MNKPKFLMNQQVVIRYKDPQKQPLSVITMKKLYPVGVISSVESTTISNKTINRYRVKYKNENPLYENVLNEDDLYLVTESSEVKEFFNKESETGSTLWDEF